MVIAHYCEHKHKCKWQGFHFHQGLAWGEIPKAGSWLEWHERECGGRLIPIYEGGDNRE